jgi:hypothetical protein
MIMNWRHGMLALVVAAALASQASAQVMMMPFGGWGGGFPNMNNSTGWNRGYPYPGGYFPGGGWGGYGFSTPTVWQSSPIIAYTGGTTVTQPVIPPDSPAWRDPGFVSWAREHGYYLRPGERAPRYRPQMYPATPVDRSDLQLPSPRALN